MANSKKPKMQEVKEVYLVKILITGGRGERRRKNSEKEKKRSSINKKGQRKWERKRE